MIKTTTFAGRVARMNPSTCVAGVPGQVENVGLAFPPRITNRWRKGLLIIVVGKERVEVEHPHCWFFLPRWRRRAAKRPARAGRGAAVLRGTEV